MQNDTTLETVQKIPKSKTLSIFSKSENVTKETNVQKEIFKNCFKKQRKCKLKKHQKNLLKQQKSTLGKEYKTKMQHANSTTQCKNVDPSVVYSFVQQQG